MIVSLRRAAREQERSRVKGFLKTQEEEGRVTIGDVAGELLRRVVERPQTEASPNGESGAAAAELPDVPETPEAPEAPEVPEPDEDIKDSDEE